ncbi:unnamed protein product, partial [marine sediment metagenome]
MSQPADKDPFSGKVYRTKFDMRFQEEAIFI